MSGRVCAPLDRVPAALAKTGFILEHLVADLFEKSGWATIGGRYYADDVDGSARELDLVAYRSDHTKELEVITAVLISCKKDEENTWAFLTKSKPKIDPNFDWDPVHYWTDVQPLSTYLGSDSWKDEYIKAGGAEYQENFKAARSIFAFQQVASLKVTAQNDKAIFNSIVTLMKALDHEVEAVPARAKGRRRLYTFWLLSVVDAPMVDVSYSGSEPEAVEVERMTHLARYMVRKRDLSALIHFVRSDKLPACVSAMTKLAAASAKHMGGLVETSFESIMWNQKVRDFFAPKLKPLLAWRITRSFRKNGSDNKVEYLGLGFADSKLVIFIDAYDDDDLEMLNADKELRQQTAKVLKDIARYEGAFVFDGVPF